jgi:hypothetical protein
MGLYKKILYTSIAGILGLQLYTAQPAYAMEMPQKQAHTTVSSQEQRQTINTRLSIDEYVDRYGSRNTSDFSDRTLSTIQKNRDTIKTFANEYNVPANLLATIIAIEQEGTDGAAVDGLWNRVKDLPLASQRDSTEGIANIKLSVAGWLLADIYRQKGEQHVSKGFPAIRKFGSELKGISRISDYQELSKETRNALGNELRTALDKNDKLSIELAAKYVSYMKESVKRAHQLSDANYLTNPVAILLTMSAYRGGERQITHLEFTRKPGERADYLAPLRSGSGINAIFGNENNKINPTVRYLSYSRLSDSRRECVACSTPKYIEIAGTIQDAISLGNQNQFVRASSEFSRAADAAYAAAKSSGRDDERQDFYRLALYSLSRARGALSSCGVDRIKVYENGKVVQKNTDKVLEGYLSKYRLLYNKSGSLGGSKVVLPMSKTYYTVPTLAEMQKDNARR